MAIGHASMKIAPGKRQVKSRRQHRRLQDRTAGAELGQPYKTNCMSTGSS